MSSHIVDTGVAFDVSLLISTLVIWIVLVLRVEQDFSALATVAM